MTKKSITFSVALSQTAKPKRRGAPSKLDKLRKQLETTGEWEMFREALVDTTLTVRSIHDALTRMGFRVNYYTVVAWRRDAIANNKVIWAQVERDLAEQLIQKLEASKGKGN